MKIFSDSYKLKFIEVGDLRLRGLIHEEYPLKLKSDVIDDKYKNILTNPLILLNAFDDPIQNSN